MEIKWKFINFELKSIIQSRILIAIYVGSLWIFIHHGEIIACHCVRIDASVINQLDNPSIKFCTIFFILDIRLSQCTQRCRRCCRRCLSLELFESIPIQSKTLSVSPTGIQLLIFFSKLVTCWTKSIGKNELDSYGCPISRRSSAGLKNR